MKFTVPHPGEGSPAQGDEIAWRRELKQLRVRVGQLEAEKGIKQAPSLESTRDGKHGYGCGMPCGVVVYDKQPIVECKVCGAKLDPIEVLRDYAHHERNFCYSLEHLRKERRDLTAENKKLKALRARLRAEARALLPEPPVNARRSSKWDRAMVANAQLDRVLRDEPGEP